MKPDELSLQLSGSLRKRLEFGFCLLPELHIQEQIVNFASKIQSLTNILECKKDHSNDNHHILKLPHVSLGQYGVLSSETNTLQEIVKDASSIFHSFLEPISPSLTLVENNVFMDFQNIFENTSLNIISLYHHLRNQYMKRIKVQFPISQASKILINPKTSIFERKLISQYYQNWGIPEFNRIRPHITLFYDLTLPSTPVIQLLKKVKFPKELTCIKFPYISILLIDSYGNSIYPYPLYSFPLKESAQQLIF